MVNEEKNTNRIVISLSNKLIREAENGAGEKQGFYNVFLPKGISINGKDLGGYSFTSNYVWDSQYSETMKGIPVYLKNEEGADNHVTLKKYDKDTGETDKVEVTTIELAAAFEQSKTAYKEELKEKHGENVWLNIHEKFIFEKSGQHGDFMTVLLPAGTTVNGKDIGGYSFNVQPFQVSDDKILRNVKGIRLGEKDNITLSKLDENGNAVKEIATPKELQAALKEGYLLYKESKKQAKEENDKAPTPEKETTGRSEMGKDTQPAIEKQNDM